MQLPVLDDRSTSVPSGDRQDTLARELAGLIRGEVRFDRHNRLLYATDASLYQVEPIGVVIPANIADVERTVRFCAERAIALLPRGGGTSLAGQCTNRALVVDMSAHCRGIGRVEPLDAPSRIGPQARFPRAASSVWVEPGVTVDELNRELAGRSTGLFFAPDPATTAQCCIGGCIGNNAAGGRSIRYGRTSENIAGLDVMLTSGERLRLEPGAGARNPVARRLAAGVIDIVRPLAAIIRERFPGTIRRNAGYALDLVLDQLDAGADSESLDLSGLLCGSEGTLAVTLGANVELHPLPTARALAVVSFTSLEAAIDAVKPILDAGLPLGLSAVELLDDVVLEAARGNLEHRRYVDLLPGADAARAEPKAVLYVEFSAFDHAGRAARADISDALAALRDLLDRTPGLLPGAVHYHTDAAAMLAAWKLRKAGEPLLHGLPGRRKPVTFVEDNAVPVERLAEFVREFKKIVARHSTRAAYWAHASVGVLHVRPMIDLHDEADRRRMREIAVEVADLARACGGVMSGEHGDGRVRGPLLERFFGPALMRAFADIKRLFDPKGLLNPGNIVGAGQIESITENLRALAAQPSSPIPNLKSEISNFKFEISSSPSSSSSRSPSPPSHSPLDASDSPTNLPATFFDFSDQHGLRGATEMCNGAGVCRKRSGGTMCPSYMATLDERHSTRGRGNALRLAITGQIARDSDAQPSGQPAWNDPATIETLDLCLSCKACKSECPSNVDIARLKAEYTAQRYRTTGRVPLSARAIGHIRLLNRLGSTMPGPANWAGNLRLSRWLLRRLLGISDRRSLPRFRRSLYTLAGGTGFQPVSSVTPHAAQPGDDRPRRAEPPRVALFADCFTTYNESHIGLAAIRVLKHLGYSVELLPREGAHGFASGCCARSMISVGLLEDAIATADRTLALLRPAIEDHAVEAILVCEPSCLSAFKDDWLQLKLKTPRPLREKLAAKSFLVEDFISRIPSYSSLIPHPSSVIPTPVLLHAHCHQEALWGADTSATALRALVGDRLAVLDSGCCGMAGSFGYATHRYALSMKIGELSLMPAIGTAGEDAIIVAGGTSCRHQIKDATGRRALHPIEFIAQSMGIRP